jgi:large subunit ribosomal protein L15
MPLQRRIPKRGFTNARFRKRFQEVNVRSLVAFEAGSEVSLESLAALRLVRSTRIPVKILGDGDIDRALTVKVAKVTAAARAKIEAAGGTIQEA